MAVLWWKKNDIKTKYQKIYYIVFKSNGQVLYDYHFLRKDIAIKLNKNEKWLTIIGVKLTYILYHWIGGNYRVGTLLVGWILFQNFSQFNKLLERQSMIIANGNVNVRTCGHKLNKRMLILY